MTERTPNTNEAAGKPRRRYPLRRGEKGQAAIEFLLVLPIFIIFFFLVVDLGMLMYNYVSISNAVREGTRYGAINCGDGSCTKDEVKTRVIQRSGGLLADPLDRPDVRVEWVDNDGVLPYYSRGDSVVVKVNHPYDFLFFPGSIDVVSCADMSLEQTDRTTTLPEGDGC